MSRALYMLLACMLLGMTLPSGAAFALAFDMASAGVVAPKGTVMAGVPVTPRGQIVNVGAGQSSGVTVTFIIMAGAATAYGPVTVPAPNVNPNIPQIISSSRAWTPAKTGTYQVLIICDAPADGNHLNDTARTTVTVIPHIYSRAEAIAIVDTGVIARSPYKDELVAFLYNRGFADSLLLPGSVVAARDGSFNDTIKTNTYLFWFDNRPDLEWYHPATFVLLDAGNGAITVHEAESWPVINGAEITRFTQEGNGSAERYRGTYRGPGGRYTAAAIANANKADWAVIVVGFNLAGPAEKVARKNDIERARECVNAIALGPRIDKGNIVVVAGADTSGASVQELRVAIRALKGKAQRKVYLFYLGHGAPGSMILRGGTSTGPVSYGYAELAAELIGAGAPENHLAIETSHAGSALEAFLGSGVVRNGKMIKLKGSAVTASSAARTTARDTNGARFIKALNASWKEPSVDLNEDGKVTLIEAVALARSRDESVAADDAQMATLGDGHNQILGPPVSTLFTSAEDGGGALGYEVFSVDYRMVKTPAGLDSIVSRRTLFVKNGALRPHHGVHELEAVGRDAAGNRSVIGEIPPQMLAPGARIRLFDIPSSYVRIEIRRKGTTLRGGVSLARRTGAYAPREGIYQEIAADADSGAHYTAKVDPIDGWGLGVDPVTFTASPLLANEAIVRGVMPDTATRGNTIHAMMINAARRDTSELAIAALLFDSVGVDIRGGSYLYRVINHYGSLAIASDTLRLSRSVRAVRANDTDRVDAGGVLVIDHSSIRPDSGFVYRFQVRGTLDWSGASLLGAGNGLELESPAGVRINGGAVLTSRNDGVRFAGDQSHTFVDELLIDGSARNGVIFQSVPSLTVRHLRVLGSGTNDVALLGNSRVTFLDCDFNDRKLAILGSSRLVRAWTTTFELVARNDSGVKGAIIEITDITGELVARDTTGAMGLSDGIPLVQYLHGGVVQENRTPYRVRIRFGTIDTVLVHDAIAESLRRVVLPLDAVAGIVPGSGEGAPAMLGQNYPNPFGGSRPVTTIPFTLERAAPAVLVVTDPLGREALRRDLGTCAPGVHAIPLDARDLSPGAYLYELRTSGMTLRGKMVVE